MEELKKHFIDCWTKIKGKYEAGSFCSERHFQAEMFHLLYSELTFTNRFKLFIEPIISGEDSSVLKNCELEGIIPDMIITEGQKIIAIVELKYVPHGYIEFTKDVYNLCRFYDTKIIKKLNPNIYLLTNPLDGDWAKGEKAFTISENLLLIYCTIGRADSDCILNPDMIWDKKYTSLISKPNHVHFIGSINPKGSNTFNPITK